MKHIPVIVAVLLVVLAFGPAAAKRQGPVADSMRSATMWDRWTFQGIYDSLADITEEDAGRQITTVGAWRDIHSRQLKFAGTTIKGKYPELDIAVNAALKEKVSLDDVPMTPELAGKLAAACREVAKQSE